MIVRAEVFFIVVTSGIGGTMVSSVPRRRALTPFQGALRLTLREFLVHRMRLSSRLAHR
jgi:hypothetical protein